MMEMSIEVPSATVKAELDKAFNTLSKKAFVKGFRPGKTPRDVEDKLEKRTPVDFKRHAHHWLILHGRYVCKARTPECWRCNVASLCAFKKKTPTPKA
jgi:endonuclease III